MTHVLAAAERNISSVAENNFYDACIKKMNQLMRNFLRRKRAEIQKQKLERGRTDLYIGNSKKKIIAVLKLVARNGFNQYQESQNEIILDHWPAQEWFKFINEDIPVDYLSIWENAGGTLFDGKMIALKNDSIWTRISKFNLPYSPFDEYGLNSSTSKNKSSNS